MFGTGQPVVFRLVPVHIHSTRITVGIRWYPLVSVGIRWYPLVMVDS